MSICQGGDTEPSGTARLDLAAAGLKDLEAVALLLSDERVWCHFPSGRHTNIEQTRAYLSDSERQWQRDGLGHWVARLRQPVETVPVGGLAGIGGCAASSGGDWWNLYYRLVPEVQGHGLASEICQVAIQAAHRVRPDRPIIARLLEHNRASKATAQRAGLNLIWRGPAIGRASGAFRLIFADRPIDDQQLDAVKQLE